MRIPSGYDKASLPCVTPPPPQHTHIPGPHSFTPKLRLVLQESRIAAHQDFLFILFSSNNHRSGGLFLFFMAATHDVFAELFFSLCTDALWSHCGFWPTTFRDLLHNLISNSCWVSIPLFHAHFGVRRWKRVMETLEIQKGSGGFCLM